MFQDKLNKALGIREQKVYRPQAEKTKTESRKEAVRRDIDDIVKQLQNIVQNMVQNRVQNGSRKSGRFMIFRPPGLDVPLGGPWDPLRHPPQTTFCSFGGPKRVPR